MSYFYYQKLRARSNDHQDLLGEINLGEHLEGQRWGVFTGLFGLASNEVIVVGSFADGDSLPAPSPLAVAAEQWTPTARPLTPAPCQREGLYVFRRFHVRPEDVDEVVALSAQAWNTFEVSDEYAAEPQGLFRPPPDQDGIVRMMLVTWYDGFESWQRSRQPAPEARENFRRRRALTSTSYAMATRLALP